MEVIPKFHLMLILIIFQLTNATDQNKQHDNDDMQIQKKMNTKIENLENETNTKIKNLENEMTNIKEENKNLKKELQCFKNYIGYNMNSNTKINPESYNNNLILNNNDLESRLLTEFSTNVPIENKELSNLLKMFTKKPQILAFFLNFLAGNEIFKLTSVCKFFYNYGEDKLKEFVVDLRSNFIWKNYNSFVNNYSKQYVHQRKIEGDKPIVLTKQSNQRFEKDFNLVQEVDTIRFERLSDYIKPVDQKITKIIWAFKDDAVGEIYFNNNTDFCNVNGTYCRQFEDPGPDEAGSLYFKILEEKNNYNEKRCELGAYDGPHYHPHTEVIPCKDVQIVFDLVRNKISFWNKNLKKVHVHEQNDFPFELYNPVEIVRAMKPGKDIFHIEAFETKEE
jgi:hypothetical protein